MTRPLIILAALFYVNVGLAESSFQKVATDVPIERLHREVAGYLQNELAYTDSFESEFVLVRYQDAKTQKAWYVVDGYFTLKDRTILFLDFDYDPTTKNSRAINNYVFVPEENQRFLLKATEVCNPFDRQFLGVIVFGFKEPGHLDELMGVLSQTLNGSPMLYTDGKNHMIQDLTAPLSPQPLFTLKENTLIQKLKTLPYLSDAMMIPSGRNPSDEAISQTYIPVTPGCKL